MIPSTKARKILLIAIFIGLLILPFLWFGDKLFLGGDDNKSYFYDISNYIKNIPLYSWVDSGALGTFSTQQFAIFYLGLIYILNLVLPNYVVQVIFYGLILALAFIFQYKFVTILFNSITKRTNQKNIHIASLISSLFYIIAPISFHLLWRQPNHMTYGLSLLPIVLYFFIKSINENKVKHLIILGLTFLFFAMVILPIIPLVITFAGAMMIFFFFYSYKLQRLKIFFKNSLILLLIFGVSMSFWLFPFVQGGISKSQETMIAINLDEEVREGKVQYAENLIAASANVLYPLLTQIDFPFYKDHDTGYYLSTRKYVVVEMTLLFLLYIVVSLFYIKKYNKKFKFIYLSLFGITIGYLACSAVRINDYFVTFWIWCMNNIPLFTMWRSQQFFHVPYVLLYSTLLGMAFFMILEAIKRRLLKIILCIISVISLIVVGIPLLLGIAPTGPASLQTEFSSVVKVPDELEEMLENIRHLPADYKMMNMPLANPEYFVFRDKTGGMFEGPTLVDQLTGKTHFSGLVSFRNVHTDFYNLFLDMVTMPEKKDYIRKVFATFNLKYVLMSKDEEFFNKINYPYNFNTVEMQKGFRNFKNYRAALDNANFGIIAENEGFALYEDNEKSIPKVFTTDDYSLVNLEKVRRIDNGKAYYDILNNPLLNNGRNVIIYNNNALFKNIIDKMEKSIHYIPLIQKPIDEMVSDNSTNFNQYDFFVTYPGAYDLYTKVKNLDVFAKYDKERGWLIKVRQGSPPGDFLIENKETGEKKEFFAEKNTEQQKEIIKEVNKDDTLTVRIVGQIFIFHANEAKEWKYIGQFHTDLKNSLEIFYKQDTGVSIPDFSTLDNWSPHVCGGRDPADIASTALIKEIVKDDNSQQNMLLVGIGENNVACAIADTINFIPGKLYKISFEYKNLEGNGADYNICSDVTCTNAPLTFNQNKWSYYEIAHMAKPEDKRLRLYFYSNANKAEDNIPTKTLFRNPKIGIYEYRSLNMDLDEPFYLQKTEIPLEKGNNKIEYLPFEKDYKEQESYMANFNEELPNWGQSDCNISPKTEAKLRFEQSDDSKIGKKSLLISAANDHNACVSTNMTNFISNKIYKFSFYYKNIEGNPPELAICPNKIGACFTDKLKENYNTWNYYTTFYRPQDIGEIGVRVYLYANAKDVKQTTILFDDIQIERFDASIYPFFIRDNRPEESDKPAIVEYKRISIEKYRLRIKNLSSSRLVTLLENYDPNWKAYVVKSGKEEKIDLANAQQNKDYIGNLGATDQEVKFLAKQGWLSALGDEFISKFTYDTIQNDNIPSGYIWDTWFKESLPEENHIFVNGYVNSWWIDLETLEKEGKIKKNEDGTYNFEMVLEFWPQRMFWLGFSITIGFIVFAIGYLVRLRYKKKQ